MCAGTPNALRLQLSLQKLRRRGIDLQPVPMAQEVMYFVGNNAFLDVDTVDAADEIDRLVDADIAIVVAVDEVHG